MSEGQFGGRETESISVGGIWEERQWYLELDLPLFKTYCACPHFVDGVNPAVIVAYNEGGCNTTGLCARCVYEALQAFYGDET